MDWPLLSLLPIGVAAAVSPCPLATNIAAVGFISRGIGSRHQSAIASLLYTLGRVSAYVLIGWLVSRGLASVPMLSFWMQEELPVYLGPVMMVAGLILLGFIPFFSLGKKPGEATAQSLMAKGGIWGAFALGFLFALALCPPSAALFFGTAVPLSIQAGSTGSLLGISLFGIGTALPVVAFALLLTFSAEKAAAAVRHMPKIQQIMKLVTGWFFLLLGVYWLFSRILLV